MKKTLLKVNDLCMQSDRFGKLEHISFQIYEEEINGLLGLNYSGKELLLKVLSGASDLDFMSSNIFFRGKRVQEWKDYKSSICYINMKEDIVGKWTVAEYISLKHHNWFLTKGTCRAIENDARSQIKKLGMEIDVSKRMCGLSALERRMVELARVCRSNAELLLIEDECEGMDEDIFHEYSQLLRKAISGGRGIIIQCNSRLGISILADNYIVLRKGRIVKKCKNCEDNKELVDSCLLGRTMYVKKKNLDDSVQRLDNRGEEMYSIRKFDLDSGFSEYVFAKGEITTFTFLNSKRRMDFFMEISGRRPRENEKYYINGTQIKEKKFDDFVKKKIVSVMRIGEDYEIFEKMTVGDNILFPSLKKVSAVEYLLSEPHILQSVCNEKLLEGIKYNNTVSNLDKNSHLIVSLQRWYLFNPKVIVLYEPFSSCDAYGVSIIRSFLKKFANRGTSVIVIKSNSEYMNEISDRVYHDSDG